MRLIILLILFPILASAKPEVWHFSLDQKTTIESIYQSNKVEAWSFTKINDKKKIKKITDWTTIFQAQVYVRFWSFLFPEKPFKDAPKINLIFEHMGGNLGHQAFVFKDHKKDELDYKIYFDLDTKLNDNDFILLAFHEIQHLFNKSTNSHWLSEGLSLFIENYFTERFPGPLVGQLNFNQNDLTLFNWDGTENAYALSFLFVNYLYYQYEDINIIRELILDESENLILNTPLLKDADLNSLLINFLVALTVNKRFADPVGTYSLSAKIFHTDLNNVKLQSPFLLKSISDLSLGHLAFKNYQMMPGEYCVNVKSEGQMIDVIWVEVNSGKVSLINATEEDCFEEEDFKNSDWSLLMFNGGEKVGVEVLVGE